MKKALTIAGSDSGGGAGIQADLKTFAAHGVWGTSAIAAITAQNTLGVTAALPLPCDIITAQIEAVATDIGVDAVKIGMLATTAIVYAVAAALVRLKLVNVVVDPVMVSKGGAVLLAGDAVDAVRKQLLPRATVVTPNTEEAEVLTGFTIRSVDDSRLAARRIHDMGPAAVIVKGGHLPTADVVDVLFDGRYLMEFRHARVPGTNTHGTGCTFAAAIAANLALGRTLEQAVPLAEGYVEGAIRHGAAVGRGVGVLNHFWNGAAQLEREPPNPESLIPSPEPRACYTELLTPMPPTLLGITHDELDLAALVRLVTGSSDLPRGRHGAIVTFLGTVRGENLGRRVLELEYQAYEPLAVRAFGIIAAEVADSWPEARLALHHRVGTLGPGEASVAIAVASPHRAEGFRACRYAIERVKQIAPIWKREIFEGGEAWIEGATADPDDSAARQAAFERACR